jgi:hypothetical protein
MLQSGHVTHVARSHSQDDGMSLITLVCNIHGMLWAGLQQGQCRTAERHCLETKSSCGVAVCRAHGPASMCVWLLSQCALCQAAHCCTACHMPGCTEGPAQSLGPALDAAVVVLPYVCFQAACFLPCAVPLLCGRRSRQLGVAQGPTIPATTTSNCYEWCPLLCPLCCAQC